ncbi:hypothetical protein F5Y15DRAFT_365701 [Xylariaceae sp. FL0016]|nr:hypothetical protein F5Y15DRAFT_365701 [Xylariaceae sp. FL0016]
MSLLQLDLDNAMATTDKPLPTRRIQRKPVANVQSEPISSYDALDDLVDDYQDVQHAPWKPQLVSRTRELDIRETEREYNSPTEQLTIPLVPSPSEISPVSVASAPLESKSSKSLWTTAVDETIHFAGGLISRPFESTDHFTILRHSPGLVYYKGPSTCVKISIFSDMPLPPDRSFWLQRRGYSGNLGMATSAFFRTTKAWIDVTPTSETVLSDIPESDERAWQRDIGKFTKKATKDRRLSKHSIRQSCVIRIPSCAADGYLRIVMCTGERSKRTLCASPVFRIASTSSDVSIIRGASLTTMPLEAGLKVASIAANQTVAKWVGPAQAIVNSQLTKVKKFQPNILLKEAEKVALAKTTVKTQFLSYEENFDAARDATYDPFHEDGVSEAPPDLVGADAGPEKPFPIKFAGNVTRSTGRARSTTGTPTANLIGISSDLLLRLNGIYLGWAAVQPKQGLEHISHDWHEAIITIGPSPYAGPRVAAKNVTTVHLIHDFGEMTFFDAKLQVIIMAYVRPVPRPDPSSPNSDLFAAVSRDIETTLASLSREKWQPEMTVHRLKTAKSQRSMAEKYVDARSQIQKSVDRVPLHWAGIRTEGAERIDQARGRGGYYIQR